MSNFSYITLNQALAVQRASAVVAKFEAGYTPMALVGDEVLWSIVVFTAFNHYKLSVEAYHLGRMPAKVVRRGALTTFKRCVRMVSESALSKGEFHPVSAFDRNALIDIWHGFFD